MTVAHARALLRSPILVDADPHGDRLALERLARWAMRFSPVVGVDTGSVEEGQEPDSILIDITGCELVFHGEECLLGLISASLAGLRLHHRLGVAPTIGAAWAAAHYGEDPITQVGSTASPPSLRPDLFDSSLYTLLSSFLSQLPIGALRLPARTAEALTELGLDRVEDFLQLPRASIPSRFGPETLQRLDQALGRLSETITPIRLDPPLRLERLLEGPTTNHEAIELVIRELLSMLADELSRREAGVVSLALQLDRLKRDCRGTETISERLRLSRPTRSPRHLWSLLRPRVERINLGYGVEGISLVVIRQRRLRHRQLSRDDIGRKDPGEYQSGGELIDTLVNRLGAESVQRIRLRDSHIPEQAAALEPVIGVERRREDPEVLHRAEARCHAAPRPSVLFDHPQSAQAVAMMPDRPPTLLRWQGQDLRIVTGIGPERLGTEWWKKKWQSGKGAEWQSEKGPSSPNTVLLSRSATFSLSFRDYFRIQDHTGRWLWVYRDDGLWFVHGLWA